jgi:hypothetical protein
VYQFCQKAVGPHFGQFFHELIWDRCYDFKNIFAEKFSEKIGVFDSKQSQILKNIYHNIGF